MATAVDIEMTTLAPIAREVQAQLPMLFRFATLHQDDAASDDEAERWGKVRDMSIRLLGLLNEETL